MYLTVSDVAARAGVSARTIRYYDEIGLFKPTKISENGYRYYRKEAFLRLQQILLFREMDFSLKDIKEMLDRPDFDQLKMMERHRAALVQRVGRLNRLIDTVDKTILHLQGVQRIVTMEFFDGFDEETQVAYAEAATERWDSETVEASNRRWDGYSAEQKADVMAEAKDIHQDILDNMDKGFSSVEVQLAVSRWYMHLHHFFEPSLETLRGLGQAYEEDPEFAAFYEQIHPDMPGFFRRAIEFYCDEMEVWGVV